MPIRLACLCLFTLSFALGAAGDDKIAFEPPEVAVGTFTCKAQWNEFCEDQKTIQVPTGHKLCKESITVIEKSGISSYELVSKDALGVTIKFSAKGNGDRFKQQGANIALKISLQGVHENQECFYQAASKDLPLIITTPTVAATQEPTASITLVAEKPESTSTALSNNTISNNTMPNDNTGKPVEAKPHACACSQWLQADQVFNCLAKGHGRDNTSCDSFNASITCVASKDECREIQKENCEQVLGINQSTSKKRIFVPGSPYCASEK